MQKKLKMLTKAVKKLEPIDPNNVKVPKSCLGCSKCCAFPVPDDTPGERIAMTHGQPYVELLHADLINLGINRSHYTLAHYDGRSPGSSGFAIAVINDSPFATSTRCPFLVGRPGDKCDARCGVYDKRPVACRIYERGGHGCKQMLRLHAVAEKTRMERHMTKTVVRPAELPPKKARRSGQSFVEKELLQKG